MKPAIFCALLLILPCLIACGGNSGGNVVTFEPAVFLASSDSLSASDYQEEREAFLAEMQRLQAENEAASHSVAGLIRSGVAIGGLVVGLGGTAAGLLLENDDAKATVSQIGGSIAAVSGILGLLPIGNAPHGAEASSRYLETRIKSFESLWPSSGPDLTAPKAAEFRLYMEETRATLRSLGSS